MKSIQVVVLLVLSCLAGCGDSSDFQQLTGQQGNSNAPNQPSLIYVAQAGGGQLDVAPDGMVRLRIDQVDPQVLLGDNGERGTVTVDQFLQATTLPGESTRPVLLAYKNATDEMRRVLYFRVSGIESLPGGGLSLSGRIEQHNVRDVQSIQGQTAGEIPSIVGQTIREVRLRVGRNDNFLSFADAYIFVDFPRAGNGTPTQVRFRSRDKTLDYDKTFPAGENQTLYFVVPYSALSSTNYEVYFMADGFVTTSLIARVGVGDNNPGGWGPEVACSLLQQSGPGAGAGSFTLRVKNDNLFNTDSNGSGVELAGGGYFFRAETGEKGEAKFEQLPAGVPYTVTAYTGDGSVGVQTAVTLQNNSGVEQTVTLPD